jgi:uncharacterized glyoxalase superfamily protein PhnB
MNPLPPGWPRLSSCIVYPDAAKAIDWLCDAFGFEVRLRVEDDAGRIVHSELTYGEGVIMVSEQGDMPADAHGWKRLMKSPAAVGGANTQMLMLYVDDARAHCEHARSRGATIVDEPDTHDYGDDYWADLSYGAIDPGGHVWWIAQRLRSGAKA